MSIGSAGSTGDLSLPDGQQTPSYKGLISSSLKRSANLALKGSNLSRKFSNMVYGKPKSEEIGLCDLNFMSFTWMLTCA